MSLHIYIVEFDVLRNLTVFSTADSTSAVLLLKH